MTSIVMCAVCFSGAEPLMRQSLNAGILVLLGVTGVVLAAFAAFFGRLARAARRADGPLAGGDPHLVTADGPAQDGGPT
jgi:hypothetical protein